MKTPVKVIFTKDTSLPKCSLKEGSLTREAHCPERLIAKEKKIEKKIHHYKTPSGNYLQHTSQQQMDSFNLTYLLHN